MTRKEKDSAINTLVEKIQSTNHFYLTDISSLDALKTSELRRMCFSKDIELTVVKNTLLQKALERLDGGYDEIYQILKGNTAVMFTEIGNAPAKLIKEFRKKSDKPELKAAYVEQSIYIGDDQLEALVNVKSKEELVADVVLLLQSPVQKLISQLQSGGNSLTGVLKTLSEKEA